MKLIDAIKSAHKGKNTPLRILRTRDAYWWDEPNDIGYQEYSKARTFIRKYKLIEKILLYIKYI